VNYTEVSFFVNHNGWRVRPECEIDWQGKPQAFAVVFPWILAFEPTFIELRNIKTDATDIVRGKKIKMLHFSTHEISLTGRL
jgi:hypothetical protein